MNGKSAYHKQNPKAAANPISTLFFGWTKEIFWKGAKTDLIISDVYQPLKSDESQRVADRLEASWNYELGKWEQEQAETGEYEKSKKKSPSLGKALFRTFWKEYLFVGLLLSLQYIVLALIYPVILSWIISYFRVGNGDRMITRAEVLTYAAYLMIVLVLSVLVMHHTNLLSQQIGMRLRVACCSLVYRKILRLSRRGLTQITSGQVVNLLSNDVSRFDELCYYLNFVWLTPLQIISISAMIWHRAGVPGIIGIGVLLLMTIPSQSFCIKVSKQLRTMIAVLTDKRIQLMNELISGIQVIKMYAWERPFEKIVQTIRAAEITRITRASYVRGMYLALVVFTNRAVLFFTLLSFFFSGKYPKANVIFMLSSYFEILQLTTTLLLPQALLLLGETAVCSKRLQDFLLIEEQLDFENTKVKVHQNGVTKFKKENTEMENMETIKIVNGGRISCMNNIDEHKAVSIELERVSANWNMKHLPPTLCNVSMKVRGGELCALVGSVGSGKSSILQLLLKELPLGAGRLRFHCKPFEDTVCDLQGYIVDCPGLKISYASQEPWLFNGTVRDNILFGQPYDKERYTAVTKVCALTKDFLQFPYGDMSNVGEGGSSLSGGQRARINLARAVYRQADVYLLDDPLSAVDTRVAKHLFYRCIKQYLNGKSRILVTHQLQFLKQADTIAVLDRGCMRMQGTYDELSMSSKDFTMMMNRIKMSAEDNKQNEEVSIYGNTRRVSKKSRVSVTSVTSSVVSYDYEDPDSAPDNDEMTKTGRVSNEVYKKYFRYGGSCLTIIALVFVFIISQVATSGNDYWVSYFTNLESIRQSMGNGTSQFNDLYRFYVLNGTLLANVFNLDNHGLMTTSNAFYVYMFCILSCIVTVFVRNLFFIKVCANAGKNLHNSMFSNILQATMNFFNNNTSGRILNRFSKDVGAMDEMLPKVMLETIQVFTVIAGILVMVITVNNWMLIPLIILTPLFLVARTAYLRTVQGVKRLEGIAKSPVLSHVNSTLNGLVTIRSSGLDVADLLRKQFDDLQDVHSGAWFLTITAPEAFGLYVDVFVILFIACLCFSFILTDTGHTLGGNVGLAMAQSLIVIGALQHGVKRSGEMVSNVTSVERILQYTDLPKEKSWTSKNPPPSDWPKYGRVSLKNVYMKYEKDEAPVLKNLNLTIESGWKVGVVGRTGAGKSSLISALFRLFANELEGEIKIDERDTSTLGLHELRSRLSIIPQQPFLLSATVRFNLDPFNRYNDVSLWDSLQEVELNDLILDQKIMSGGSNLSIGEKQLICLARAILRRNKILILDEATANIDTRTDELIQRTIRTKFADCTVITIAHRLNTIIDCDRIIVMDAGNIAEFGCPHELLQNKENGIFSQMVNNTGAVMSQTLRQQAEKACLKNNIQRSLDLNVSNSNSLEEDDPNILEQSSL